MSIQIESVTQVGGTHYNSPYQHWDLVADLGLDYLRACATKYVTRSRKKNGREDLKKAVSYLEKAALCYRQYRGIGLQRYQLPNPALQLFLTVNPMNEWEQGCILQILQAEDDTGLNKCVQTIQAHLGEDPLV